MPYRNLLDQQDLESQCSYTSDHELVPDYDEDFFHLTSRLPHSRSPSPTKSDASYCTARPPKDVILALWPRADAAQVRYYLQGYTTLYPTATILLLKDLEASFEIVLQELIETDEKTGLQDDASSRGSDHSDDRVLVHCFGNRAVSNFCALLRSYSIRTSQRLGVRAVVFDDEPALLAPSFDTLKNRPFRLLTYFWMNLLRMVDWLSILWQENQLRDNTRRNLNDDTLISPDTRKCYVCPDGDVMFAWSQSGDQNESAVRKDIEVKRKRIGRDEKWSTNEERYWLGIEGVFDG